MATDRVTSIVDPEARHCHKTSAYGIDGYKGHIEIGADTEIITTPAASAGNAGDASVAEEPIGYLLVGDGTARDDAARDAESDPSSLKAERGSVYGDSA